MKEKFSELNLPYLETPDAWNHLLEAMFASITAPYRHARMWYDNAVESGEPQEIIDRKAEHLAKELSWLPEFHQVKEKFGSLRVYYHFPDERASEYRHNLIEGIVRMAEHMSTKICAECGAPATHVNSGWIKHVCKDHYVGEDDE